MQGPPPDAQSLAELREALLRPLPELPTRYLYDDRGSALFEAITRLPEYYQTRTETALLTAQAHAIVDAVRPRELAELGCGASDKVRRLIEAGRAAGCLERLTLLDINQAFLEASARRLEADYPGLSVRPVVGDFERNLAALGPGGRRLVLFLAGTVGNLPPLRANAFFTALAGRLAPDDALLLGVDLVKDPARLEAAYNDAQGVTAAFNLNILDVVNARFGADFRRADFEHSAVWDPEQAWIDLRLVARRPVTVRIPAADVTLRLAAGDSIRTEVSTKYTRDSLARRLDGTGLAVDRFITDDQRLFGLALVRPAAGEVAP